MVKLSVRNVDGFSKDERLNITTFQRYLERDFKDLEGMLSRDYIYSPFNFLYRYRGNRNICSDATFVVIDIDHTNISIFDRFENIKSEGLSCILGTTSDTNNMFKYRLLLELDEAVNNIEYRLLVRGIRVNGLVPDMDPVSEKAGGIMYAYKGSTTMSFMADKLCVKDYILEEKESEEYDSDPTHLIENFDEEFNSFSNAQSGRRTKNLLAAGFKMIRGGMSHKQLTTHIYLLNDKMLFPKSKQDVKRRVIDFLEQHRVLT